VRTTRQKRLTVVDPHNAVCSPTAVEQSRASRVTLASTDELVKCFREMERFSRDDELTSGDSPTMTMGIIDPAVEQTVHVNGGTRWKIAHDAHLWFLLKVCDRS
jgi:hypothetical protein